VRPSAIRDVGNDYWVINSLDDIRPYGICIKKEEHKNLMAKFLDLFYWF